MKNLICKIFEVVYVAFMVSAPFFCAVYINLSWYDGTLGYMSVKNVCVLEFLYILCSVLGIAAAYENHLTK